MKKINFFNAERIIRLTSINTHSIEVADEIIAKNVRIFHRLDLIAVKNLSDLWEMEFNSSSSTYCLYLYALYPVSYLLNAFEKSSEKKYLDHAKELTLSFISWEAKEKRIDKKRQKSLYGDHAVSNRTQTICYLVCCLKSVNEEIPSSITKSLLKNGEFLADEKNYSYYNHGLMMDLALVGFLNVTRELECPYPKNIEVKLSLRLQDSIVRDLTEDGVHVENSPGYHFWMLRFLEKIAPSLKPFDKELYLVADSALRKARQYGLCITRRDGTVPTIGDTHVGVKYRTDDENKSIFFKNSNQVIFKDGESDLWAFLNSGYKTHIHKHEDNGVFNLFYNGQDIFIDPGFLSYENDESSELIKAASSHNVPRPAFECRQVLSRLDVLNQKPTKDNLSESKIASFQARQNIDLAMAYISDYTAEGIVRLVVLIKGSCFLLFDIALLGSRIESGFNVSPGLGLETTKHGFSLQLKDNKKLTIEQICNETTEAEIKKVPLAKKFGENSFTEQIVFKSNQNSIATHIHFGEKKLEAKFLEFLAKGIMFDLSSRGLNLCTSKLADSLDIVVG